MVNPCKARSDDRSLAETNFIGSGELLGVEPRKVEIFRLRTNRACHGDGKDQTRCVLPRIKTSDLARFRKVLRHVDRLDAWRHFEANALPEGLKQLTRYRVGEGLVPKKASTNQTPASPLVGRLTKDESDGGRASCTLLQHQHVYTGDRDRVLYAPPIALVQPD